MAVLNAQRLAAPPPDPLLTDAELDGIHGPPEGEGRGFVARYAHGL